VPFEDAGRRREDGVAVGDVAQLVLVGGRRRAREPDDVRPALLEERDDGGADARRRAGDRGYLQIETVSAAVAVRPAASTTVARSRCGPCFSFAVLHGSE